MGTLRTIVTALRGRGKGAGVVWAVILLAFATSLTAGSIVHAQDLDEIDALNCQIGELYSNRKYVEATPLAEHYVDLARQLYGEDSPEFRDSHYLAGFPIQVRRPL